MFEEDSQLRSVLNRDPDINPYTIPKGGRYLDTCIKAKNRTREIIEYFYYDRKAPWEIVAALGFGTSSYIQKFLSLWFEPEWFKKEIRTIILEGWRRCQLKICEEGRSPFISKNRKKNADGKDIMGVKSHITRKAEGKENFAYNGDKDHDDQLKTRIRNNLKKAFATMRKNGVDIIGSYPENVLSDILFLCNINYIRGRATRVESLCKYTDYYPDFYLPDYGVYLECDGLFKFENPKNHSTLQQKYKIRHDYIERKTGKPIVHVTSDEVFYYLKHKRKLIKLIETAKVTQLSDPLLLVYKGDI